MKGGSYSASGVHPLLCYYSSLEGSHNFYFHAFRGLTCKTFVVVIGVYVIGDLIAIRAVADCSRAVR
jgi:hypothetical protein